MRMSDWSSDVFSSDLDADLKDRRMIGTIGKAAGVNGVAIAAPAARGERGAPARPPHHAGVSDKPGGVEGQLARMRLERKRVGWGKGVSERYDLGGSRITQKKQNNKGDSTTRQR